MATPLHVVDAFTSTAFGGNPAAVVLLEAPAPEPWMQAVAAEANLSDTAFVVPRADGDHDLRWFTPTVEVELCGHATLATGHVLGGTRRFHTRHAGVLETRAADDGTITMDLPAQPSAPWNGDGNGNGGDDRTVLADALGLDPELVRGAWSTANGWLLVEVAGAGAVRACEPQRDRLLGFGGHVIVTADATADAAEAHDVVSRVFVPAAGVDEDPVTGSAHCVIAPWLVERTGRTRLRAHQASRRGGELRIEVRGDRVLLTGHAVTVFTGTFLAPPSP
jgi:PhzF family phenazine biosynthesis protein